MTLAELRKRLATLQASGTDILNAADKDANRDLTAGEEINFSAIEAEIVTVKADITKAETQAERRRTMEALPSVPALEGVTDEPDPTTTNGFRGIDEFAISVQRTLDPQQAFSDPRLFAAPTNVHQGGASSGEGYLVPTQFRDEIFEVIDDLDEFGPLVDEEPTMAREVKGLADDSTPWGAAGVTANWRAEGSQMTASKLDLTPRSTPLHELYAFVNATEELLEDAPRLASRLTNGAGAALAWKKNDAMVYGTGAGQPLGWFPSAAMVSVAKVGSQVADTIVAGNITSMYSRLLVRPGDSPFWMCNRDVFPQLPAMTIGDMPVFLPPAGLPGAPEGSLLGYPIRYSEHSKTLGDKGDLMLIAPKGYYALRRESGPVLARSIHLYFDYGVEAFRWNTRFGGQPHLAAPRSPANGSATRSHFVTLDERA